MNDISVVVIHYEGAQYIEQCIASIRRQARIKEIIFVDDSSKNSPEIQARELGLTFLRHEINRGPVAARNTGAAHATGTYLLFVDVDAILDDNYASLLAEKFDTDKKLGVATGKMIENGERTWYNFGNDPEPMRDAIQNFLNTLILKFWRIWALRETLMWLSTPFTLNFVKDVEREVDWVIERAFMTRRNIFEDLGGLDEKYFMFFEGPDYCRRVREIGYSVKYVPEAICNHQGGHSHNPERRAKFFVAAREYYFKKFSKKSFPGIKSVR